MVRIYIHGRPQGQDIWCKSIIQDDEFYLKPFLGSKVGEDMAVLQVDMWHQNSYYTYIHRQNVVEYNNRPGAYFAITICFEKQYCTQVSTLYYLLDAIYNQLCLGNLIEKNVQQEHFLVAHLKEKESVLLQITDVILQNVDKFIANSLQSIEKKNDTTSAQIKLYSIVDVDSPQFIKDCLAYRVLVAPAITSKDLLSKELQQKIVAIEAQKAELQKEKNYWQSDAECFREKFYTCTNKQKELKEQIVQLQKQIVTIKDEVRNKYKSQIKQLQAELKNSEEKITKLNRQLSQAHNEKYRLSTQVEKSLCIRTLEDEKTKKTIGEETFTKESTALSKDASLIVDTLKDFARRMAGRFPFLWSKLAFPFSVFNSIILVWLLVLSLDNAEIRDSYIRENIMPNDTIIVTDSIPPKNIE